MTALTAILTIIQALPGLVTFIKELASFLKEQFGEDPGKFLMESADAFKMAREAKTPNEKMEAARVISAIIRRL